MARATFSLMCDPAQRAIVWQTNKRTRYVHEVRAGCIAGYTKIAAGSELAEIRAIKIRFVRP